jgi:hypothetical protein
MQIYIQFVNLTLLDNNIYSECELTKASIIEFTITNLVPSVSFIKRSFKDEYKYLV